MDAIVEIAARPLVGMAIGAVRLRFSTKVLV